MTLEEMLEKQFHFIRKHLNKTSSRADVYTRLAELEPAKKHGMKKS